MRTSKPQLYFHVGAERTGTKFVQSRVFPFFEDIVFINRPKYHSKDEIIHKKDSDKYLISYEFNFKGEFEEELHKLARQYPESKIILVLRSQDSWITSQYKRSIKNGNNHRFDEFLNLNGGDGVYKGECLLYLPKIKLIQKLFVEKPLVLLYKDLRDNPLNFTQVIADYLEVSFNKENINLKRKHTSYNRKQLLALKKVTKRVNIKRKKISKNPVMNFVYRLYVDAIRYSVIYGSKLFPDNFFDDEAPLIKPTEIENVRNYYETDWKETKAYIKQEKLNLP